MSQPPTGENPTAIARRRLASCEATRTIAQADHVASLVHAELDACSAEIALLEKALAEAPSPALIARRDDESRARHAEWREHRQTKLAAEKTRQKVLCAVQPLLREAERHERGQDAAREILEFYGQDISSRGDGRIRSSLEQAISSTQEAVDGLLNRRAAAARDLEQARALQRRLRILKAAQRALGDAQR
jgi:hypothetical protein